MDWVTVIGLIVFGIALIVVEVIFVPGTTVVGIFGFLISGYGIYLGYDYFGESTGNMILVGSSIVALVVLFYSFKSGVWKRFSLKDTNTSRVNDYLKFNLKIGDDGVMMSPAKPVGKALFNDREIEVRSNDAFINENTKVRIIKIDSFKIYIEPIN